jgi:DNA-binding transcriptional MocR family regulator
VGQNVGLDINPRLQEPIYQQIFDEIVRRIQTRAFPPGYKLPPSRVLARELATHRNTVARAYTELEVAGFVSSTVGRGTFVEAQVEPVTADADKPPGADPMPWSALLSRAAHPDRLGRAERYARRVDERKVINLARMQPSRDLIPEELMRRSIESTLAKHGSKAMSYAPPEGVLALREQIAQEVASRGVPASPTDILITSGSQQALDLVARTLLNPGDTVLVDSTTYSGAIDLFGLAGARLVVVQGDGQGPDLAALNRLTRPDVKALYLMPDGHNPSGLTISTARRRALIAWSRAARVPIVEDDYGAGLMLDEQQAPPHLRTLDGEVIHVSTFSKRLLPALRIGFIVCPPALRSALISMKRVVDLGTSAILQLALADFIERGYLRAHMNRILPAYRARRDTLEIALRKAVPAEVLWQRPSHGVVLWLRLPQALDPDAVYEEALRAGVLVSPSPMWSVDSNAHPENGLRLSYCAEPPDRLAQGARRLGRALRTLVDRASRGKPAGAPTMEVV